MNINDPSSQALIAALKASLANARADLAPQLDAAGYTDPDARAANEIQNVLRLCLEVCLHETPGFTENLPPSLAMRLASYAISSLPDDQHENAIAFVAEVLPQYHAQRMASGIRIKTEWAPASDMLN